MSIESISTVMNNVNIQPSKFERVGSDAETRVTDNTGSTQAAQAIDSTIRVIESAEDKKFSDGSNGQQDPKEYNEKLKKAVENLNKSMPHSEAVYGFHDGTDRITIKIVDKDTRKVIKELPPEKTLDMIVKVWEIAGMMVDEKR